MSSQIAVCRENAVKSGQVYSRRRNKRSQLPIKLIPIDDFNLQVQAAKAGKFMRARPELQGSPLSALSYAFQFDAALYAAFLQGFSEKNGVTRTEGKIVKVTQAANTGHIESVTLDDGECIKGDLFIECSGFKGLLIEETLKTGYDDWSHYLPCDSAVTRLSERMAELPPYTRATAKTAGWQWRIPLQSRTGNGYVFASQFLSDINAIESLNQDLDTPPISEPRQLKFKTGFRKLHINISLDQPITSIEINFEPKCYLAICIDVIESLTF